MPPADASVRIRAQPAHGINTLDFEPLARVMILVRDTELGACRRHGARKTFFPGNLNPLNQAIIPVEVLKRGAGE